MKKNDRGFITQKVLRMIDFVATDSGCEIKGPEYENFRRFLIVVKRSARKTDLEAKLLPFVSDLVFKDLTDRRSKQCDKKVEEARAKILSMAAAGVPIEAGEFSIVRSIVPTEKGHMAIFEAFDKRDEEEWEALPAVRKPRRRS
jgi:hypothetical protein